MKTRKEIQIATDKVGILYWIHDLNKKQSIVTSGTGFGYEVVSENVPECFRGTGDIYPEDEDAYFTMFQQMEEGVDSCECYARILNHNLNVYQWLHIAFSKLGGGRYIGSSIDVTEQMRVKRQYQNENAIRKELMKDSVFSYQINLTKEIVEEKIAKFPQPGGRKPPFPLTKDAWNWGKDLFVNETEKQEFAAEFEAKNLLDAWDRGVTNVDIKAYRLKIAGETRWFSSNVTMMKRPGTEDIIAVTYTYDVNDKENNKMATVRAFSEEMEFIAILDVKSEKIRLVSAGYEQKSVPPVKETLFQIYHDDLLKNFVLDEDQGKFANYYNIPYMKEMLRENQVYVFTYRCKFKDGEIKRKKLRIFYLDEMKEKIVIARRDITDLYNEEIRQGKVLKDALDAAESANRAKSVFLSQMSHDMRTPLNAIIGLSNRELVDDTDEKEKIQYLDEIHESGEYLLGLINDVLDMSKIESGKMILQPEPYSIGNFKKMIETVIGKQCERKGINFVFSTMYTDSEVQTIYVDKTRFNQIFVNLLSNAVKFTPPKGTVELALDMREKEPGEMELEIQVKDTGIGMSQEFLPHAFESFSQEIQKNKIAECQGTGLGLAIVKELVKQMDGSISVESKLEKGSKFVVYMAVPLARYLEEEKEISYRDASRKVWKAVPVLLCEDHPLNAKIAKALFEKKGLQVDLAENGIEGVSMFEASKEDYYQMIFMDIRMPKMDGIEATRRIRKLKRKDAAKIPIVAMTANAFDEDKEASMKVGMNAHVSKPIEPKKLYQCIDWYLSEK